MSSLRSDALSSSMFMFERSEVVFSNDFSMMQQYCYRISCS